MPPHQPLWNWLKPCVCVTMREWVCVKWILMGIVYVNETCVHARVFVHSWLEGRWLKVCVCRFECVWWCPINMSTPLLETGARLCDISPLWIASRLPDLWMKDLRVFGLLINVKIWKQFEKKPYTYIRIKINETHFKPIPSHLKSINHKLHYTYLPTQTISIQLIDQSQPTFPAGLKPQITPLTLYSLMLWHMECIFIVHSNFMWRQEHRE